MPKKQKKTSNPIFKYLVIAVILTAAAFGAYSVYQFQRSDENVVGFFTCDKEGKVCEQSIHIHADIEANICGQQITFEREKGRTDKAHTHKERNKIHWEAPLKVDPQTRQPLDPSPLKISAFFEQMEITLPASCPQNANPSLVVLVHDKEVNEKLDYVWSDGDMIVVEYK